MADLLWIKCFKYRVDIDLTQYLVPFIILENLQYLKELWVLDVEAIVVEPIHYLWVPSSFWKHLCWLHFLWRLKSLYRILWSDMVGIQLFFEVPWLESNWWGSISRIMTVASLTCGRSICVHMYMQRPIVQPQSFLRTQE